jgi:hypothetical protein
MPNKRIETYAEFWPYYLSEHRQPGTRALHIFGTALAFSLFAAGLALGFWPLILAALISGYFFAWIGHFFIERNRPATFRYPLWSLISDFRLFFMFLAGRLAGEYRRHGIG